MSYTRRFVGAGGGGAATVAGVAVSLSGNNTSGALALVSSGTLRLAGGSNITLSQNGQSITIMGGAGGGGGTLSFWEPNPINQVLQVSRVLGQSSLWLYPLYIPDNLSATQFVNLMTITVSTSAGSSVGVSLSESVGLYTISGSTLNLLTASSGATNVQFTNNGNASTASIQGLKGFTVPITINATPGNYWLGFVSATATAGNGNWVSMSNYVGTQVASAYLGQIGEVGVATRGLQRAGGFYSVQTAALPATIGLAELSGSHLGSNVLLYMNFAAI